MLQPTAPSEVVLYTCMGLLTSHAVLPYMCMCVCVPQEEMERTDLQESGIAEDEWFNWQ